MVQQSEGIYKKRFNALFYRQLRVTTRDYKRMIPQSELVKRCKCATPSEWVKYTTSSKVIKIMRDSKPIVLFDRLRSNFYEENRRPGLGFFYDGSTNRTGRQSIQNRLQFFREIKDPWKGIQIKDKAIRVTLKKTFFTYAKLTWRFITNEKTIY